MTTARDRPPEEAAEDTSFARGLRVFLTIADRGDIKADELATLLDTPLSTVYRYLRTLAEFGFVERQEGGYRLGPRLHISGGPTITSEELIRVAGPVLGMLAEETGETAIIARRIGTSAACLHEVQSHQALRVTCEPGTVLPLQVGAVSKVLLAFAPDDVRDAALDGAAQVRALRRELATIMRDGIARSDGDPPGSAAMAVPVMQDDGIVAAIAVLAPIERADLAWRARTTRLLVDAAKSVAADLQTQGRV
ncbi:MAG: IclR family transcriptional regulator [Candidatus Limnocylindrales bacterium]